MRTPLMPRRLAPAAPTDRAAPHPMDAMVETLADRAAAVTDPRLRQLLLRTACTLVDHALATKSS